MKNRFTLLILLAVLATALDAFRPNEEDEKKGSFFATVDGSSFQLKPDDLLKGTFANKSGSIDGRTPAHTIINVTFNGPSYNRQDGRPFNETVQFELNYEDQKLGEPSPYSVALQYQSTDYSLIKEISKVKVTQFTWEADHKHFRLSAEFDCKMRSWGYPMDGKKDVNLKGRMTDIRITAPSWITAKK